MQRKGIEKICRLDVLCKSLANNPCYMLTITNKLKTYMSSEDEALMLKKSNAARNMLKKKIELWELRQARIKEVREAKESVSPQKPVVKAEETLTKAPAEENTSPPLKNATPAFMTGANFDAYLNDHKKKKGVVLTCRVHPGESNA